MIEYSGVITKGIGGFYYVLANGETFECKARGIFRKNHITPLIGDNVIIGIMQTGHPLISEIKERKNSLVRPKVANVSKGAIVVSASTPKPDLLLLDKLIIWAKSQKINPLIIINKSDDAASKYIDEIMAEYSDAEIVVTSCKTKAGIDELMQRLRGERTVFAGQSAVGKSTLLNTLFSELNLETGMLSKKTHRGRHTTRHTELIIIDGIEVIDTPGFSILEEMPIEDIFELSSYYDEFAPYLGKCRFMSCLHINEPDCSVINAVEEGKINANRYWRYTTILAEIKEKRARKYD